MTLISRANTFKVPFITGDLVLSSKKKTPFVPPTINYDVSTLLNDEDIKYFPNDMAQKIYIITPHLILAMAGVVAEMKAFLKDLKIRCSYYNDLQPEHIHQFLKEYDLRKNYSGSAFFMMLSNHGDNNKLQVSHFDSGEWDELNTPIFNDLSSIGSGSETFNLWASQEINFETTSTLGNPDYALTVSVCQAARLLGIERVTLATIKKAWGAGYEVAFYTGTHFIKLDEIVYLIFECAYDEEGNISDPVLTKAMYYYYYPEILRITSLDILEAQVIEKGSQLEIRGQRIQVGYFDIPSLDIGIIQSSDNLPDDLSFYTERVAASIVVTQKEAGIYDMAFFNEGRDGFVKFQSNESFTVSLPTEIMEKMRAGAKKAFLKV
ncbi:Ntn hydrolase family protein [Chitinophaga tropicalis]|uniref:Uncharacterized protein n=1 Tax=Chitinophaga tropicalis TaxID=2683588 RepID=A0A7K1U590_9BACT|nr:hypothetical protein [Chitinophaga tropicalis]MVT09527.1 hypothetical protein [Chitinophaga tropicalis]